MGAHRAPARNGSSLVRFLWILLSAAVITVLGIIFVVIGPSNLLFPETGSAAPSGSGSSKAPVKAVIDPSTTVTVLNATGDEALTAAVVAEIRAQRWGIVEFTDATDEPADLSAVFFTDPKDEALAKGLGDQLGGVFYYLREDYSIYDTQLVVLLADDYRGPGASQ
ncbi:LytR C-terminal domain-containing protein [Leucobacter sp. M11]|uniref:LytR C-terminal domain-containing protein n=1 Tax=Leucobacter sp. M11 TaxID=2993565 RepID=UPI002D7FD587|nr:LytR C-terminal domain-containing protein [Leucobacter sp. M11]